MPATLTQYQDDFVGFKDQLTSFIFRLVAHREEAEDICQETYLKAFKNIDSFSGRSSFKTWVFTIANNLVKDNFRAKKRWGKNWMDLVKDAHVADPNLMKKKHEIIQNSPHGTFVMQEHLSYCFDCTSKTLLLINQISLLLKEVYQFKISEIMLITNLSEGKVKHAIADARKDMNRIFEKKCALINKNGICSQCTGLNKMFNPKQDAQIEANKLKMVQERNNQQSQLLDLRFAIIQNVDPLNAGGRDLHNYLFENSPAWAEKMSR